MSPSTIPLFPLPDVVLFPSVFLPLHIFEPRYRAMVEDALVGDHLIGMVLLQPGWKEDYEGRPPVYPVGCIGVLTHAERLPEGRFNIVLRGLHKFRILDEDDSRPYRLARIESIPDLAGGDPERLREDRLRLESLVLGDSQQSGSAIPSNMRDDELVHSLAQYMELEPIEKQALLECEDLTARCRSLVELLEMRRFVPRRRWADRRTH